MKFDTIIIGGGLSGLTSGIVLAEAGRRVAVVSTGQSALHFSSGSMELLGYDPKGGELARPLEAIATLEENHPYRRMGIDSVTQAIGAVRPLLDRAGVALSGDTATNHLRLTPIGALKPAWLTMEGYATFASREELKEMRVGIVELQGFMDFYPDFLAAGLSRAGAEPTVHRVSTPELERLRTSPTEMRAANIARTLTGEAVDRLADAINRAVRSAAPELVLMPAVLGYDSPDEALRLQQMVTTPLKYVSTPGASVPGIRAQMLLVRRLRRLGGIYMAGDTVRDDLFDGDRLRGIHTRNMDNDLLRADTFIQAGGSFFSQGLTARPDRIVNPALGLDVDAPEDRSQWYTDDLFAPQPYMRYGLRTADTSLRAWRSGRQLSNVHIVGAALSGADSITESSGAGIALTSAIHVANIILAES